MISGACSPSSGSRVRSLQTALHYDRRMDSEARASAPEKVEREDVQVMFMRANDDTPAAIQRAWAEFEAAVGLKGRRFFGAFDGQTREYRVCAQLKADDDPEAFGFELGTLPGRPGTPRCQW